MKFFYLLYLILFFNSLYAGDKLKKLDYFVLPNRNNVLKEIIQKENLLFKKNDTLHPSENSTYWIKFHLNNLENYDYYLFSHPSINNTLYYFDHSVGKFKTSKSGYLVFNGLRHKGLYFKANKYGTTNLYLKLEFKNFAKDQSHFIPDFSIAKATDIASKEQMLIITWLVVLAIILVCFFNIVTDYLVFKEKTQLYYLIILVGFIIYTTTFHRFNQLFIDWTILRLQFFDDNKYFSYDLSNLLNHVSIMIILYACTEITISFLMLKVNMLRLYYVLKFSLIFSLLTYVITIYLILFTSYCYIREFSDVQNLIIVLSFSILFIASIISYFKKLRYSKLFLISHSIPYIITILTAVYLIYFYYDSYTMVFLPYFSIITFTITFSVALAFRNKNIQHELKLKEIETSRLMIETKKNVIIQKSLEEKEVLLKEIHHRVKNNLQVISSLIGLQAVSIKDQQMKDIFDESKRKIQSISLIHQILYQNEDLAHIDMKEYLTELYKSVSFLFNTNKKINFDLNTNEIKFDIDTSSPLGLIFNELLTNTLKYAFDGSENANIKVEIYNIKKGFYQFTFSDNGKGFDENIIITNSLGLKLVKMLTIQLNGSFHISSENGTVITIIFEDTEQRKLSD